MFNRDGQTGSFDPMINHQLEALEPRVLLTTLVGGDIFEYINADGNTVRVVLEGDAIVELIGADINNSNNELVLGDLPGYIYQSALGRTGSVGGGLGGADGVAPIGVIRLSDADNGAPGSVAGPSATLNIQALATHPTTGNTWALQMLTFTPVGADTAITVMQVIEFAPDTGNGTVRFSKQLVGNIVAGVDAAPVTDIVAAAFDIRPGREDVLYFVTQMGGTGGSELRAVNVDTEVLDGTRRSLVSPEDFTTNGHRVTGITFDQTGAGASDYDLVISTLRKALPAEGDAVAANKIERSTVSNNFFSAGATSSVTVKFKGEFLTDITGIALKGDDAAAVDRYVYASSPDGLYLVDQTTGFAQYLGDLPDPDDSRDAPRGSDISDITWDPNSINPFTGEAGVLVGVDLTTDDLIYIDDRPRFATADLFAIYVSQSSENAKLSIAVVPDINEDDPELVRNMQPFSTTVGPVRVMDLSGEGQLGSILVSPLDSTGGVWIGARTEELDGEIQREEAIPIITATLTETLGVRASGLDTNGAIDGNLSSGIYVAPSGLEYVIQSGSLVNRLLGSNLDKITSLSANRFGDVAAVDSDRVNNAGATVGDQLFFINNVDTSTVNQPSNLGKATAGSIVNIHDGGGNLTNTAAIAYGFADLAQINDADDEELYAIVNNRFGTLDSDGLFTQIIADITAVSPAVLGANATIRSMSFAPGGALSKQTLYIIADPNGTDAAAQSALYEIVYNTDGAGVINAITGVTRMGAVNDLDINAMTFDASSRLLAQDRTNGQIVQINTTAGVNLGVVTPLAESPAGSIRSTIGGITYDLETDTILVVDNATSLQVLANEAGSVESAALMQLSLESSTQNFGSMLIGGAVTGQVYFSGSIDTFYAGWILTGATTGQGNGEATVADNFYVSGDIRNLVTYESIGTTGLGSTPTGGGDAIKLAYNTGVDINIVGRLGSIKGDNDGIFRLNVGGLDTPAGMNAQTLQQSEIESRNSPSSSDATDGPGIAFQDFRLFFGDVFSNDSLANAQILGTLASGDAGPDVIRIAGELASGAVVGGESGEDEVGGDSADFYAIALLAGQSISVRLEDSTETAQHIGIFDPDGRLIAREINGNRLLTITADRPGLYTIGVGNFTDLTKLPKNKPGAYSLLIEDAGTVTLGGVDLKGNFAYTGIEKETINVGSGDLGALRLGSLNFANGEDTYLRDINVAGNLRVINAASIGSGGIASGGGLNANVGGSIGLLSASSGPLTLSQSNFFGSGPLSTVGGDIQMISGAEDVYLDVYVNGGIGNIHAGSMPTSLDKDGLLDKSFIRVNYDGLGNDGIIDLIDVEGDLGTTLLGGPAIITGASGNVRYMRVGGTIYQDSFFSAGTPGPIIGNSVSVIDDSGARVNMQATLGGELQVETYGIRGSGGSVIVKVTTSTGLLANSVTGQNKRPAEISEIIVPSVGSELTIDPDGKTYSIEPVELDDDGEPLVAPVSVRISGSGLLDVFSITSTKIGAAIAGQVDAVVNSTGGELVNLELNTVGMLNIAGSIGTAKSNNGTAVFGRVLNSDAEAFPFPVFPFSNYRNLIFAGEFGTIISNSSIGNVASRALVTPFTAIVSTEGYIGSIYANNDNVNNADVFEGIVGPIYANADIFYIDIGEGLAAEGVGYAPVAGIYSDGAIGTITNQGLGSDIRGTISAQDGIDQINLTGGGSIIDGKILSGVDSGQATPLNGIYSVAQGSFINKIKLTGNGGIIGSYILSNIIGDITVSGGFGILLSSISNTSTGSIGNVRADGYGIRDTSIGDGNSVASIVATERSDAPLAISNYTPSVRASEFAPDTASTANDLLTALTTTGTTANYFYTAGVISGLDSTGTVSLGRVEAYRIEYATLNFANDIGSITSDEDILSGTITTGTLKSITTGSSRLQGDIINSAITVSGNLNNITVYGDINNTDIQTNNNGTLNSLVINSLKDPDTGLLVGGNFTNGSSLSVAGRINTLDIDGDIVNSSITVLSGTAGRYSINRLILGGNLFGTLELFDDVRTITVAGSLGVAGDRLVVYGDVGSLTVGSDRSIVGVEMGLDLVILGDLGSLTVNGILSGNVIVQGELKRLSVSADSTQAGLDILTGDISVTESISNISVSDGNVSGSIFAGRDLSRFSIKNGNFTSTAGATSAYGDIRSLNISGDMDGLVQVDNGELNNLRVGGDMGATAQIIGLSARSIAVSGQIVGGASIEVDRVINTITAGYIGDGATAVDIIAGGVQSITTRGIRGQNDGDIYANLVLGDSGRGSRITAGGNFGGTSVIQGDISLTVKGDVDMDITAGEYLMVNGDVSSLRVSGDLSGGIFVQGEGGNWTANSVTNAIITTGFDLRGLTVREAVTDSVVQVGIWAGQDMTFASINGQQDLGEQSRRATLGKFTADSVDNTIVAAGGDLTSVNVRNEVADSSFSAGWSVGSLAITERMGGELDGDVLREQDGRALFSGNIKSFSASDITDSYVTAGVDAGVGGDFSAPTVIYNNTIRPLVDGGGMSEVGSIRGATNVGTRIIADTGITRDSTSGAATINGNATYVLADLEQGNALPASVGVATQNSPLVYTDNGLTVTITVRGDGSVDARDLSLADGILDGLVIAGTTSRTSITIETSIPGNVDIGRIFVTDDAELNSFSFDGGIVGDQTNGLDVWFDGGIGTLDLAGFGSETSTQRVTGAIGGDVSTFNLGFQESGTLRISGDVRTMTVEAGTGDPLQITLQSYAGRNFSSLTFDDGNVFATQGNSISTIDPLNDNSITTVGVRDSALGDAINIQGLDIDNATGNVYAVAQVYNQNPTVQISSTVQDLHGLTVRPTDGAVFAVRYDAVNHVDQLVQIDPTTGALTTIGTLQSVFGDTYGTSTGSQVMSLGFSVINNRLQAILTDKDAAAGGAASGANDVAIAAISTTANAQGFVRVTGPSGNQALPAITLATNGGEVYTGMTITSGNELFVVRDDNVIVQLGLGTGVDIATHTFAGLTLAGIGLDSSNNLIGLDTISNKLYHLDLNTDTSSVLSTSTLPQSFNAFAIGRSGIGGYTTYAYDDIGATSGDRSFYTNPGVTSTLGIVDPVTGVFTQINPLVQDAFGQPLEGNVVSVTVDSANTRIKVLTDAGQLATYNNDGTFDAGTPIIDLVNSDGNIVTTISKLDFAADGRLIGVNLLSKQIVVIEPDSGLVSNLTEAGSVQGDIDAFTIDEVTGLGLFFNNSTDQVTSLAGFTQDALGGINATTISKLTLGDDYAGRIATQGDLNSLTIDGDFAGAVSAGGDIRSLKVSGGEFAGNVFAAGDINRASMRDADFTSDGLLVSNGDLSLDISSGRDFDGLFNGRVVAGNLSRLTTRSDQVSSATIITTNDAGTLNIGAGFDGTMDLAQLSRSLTLTGELLTGGSIIVQGDASTITLRDGAQIDTLIAVEGEVRSLNVSETFSGVLGIKNGVQRASFIDLDDALITIGQDSQSISVRGNVTSSLISAGVWFGDDHVYNTFDDVITGGEVRSITISGNYRDSITAVGVLPSFDVGSDAAEPDVANNYIYLGSSAIDSAEAGGLLYSVISSFSIRGEISSSDVNNGRFSGLVSANELGKVSLGQTGDILQQRVYSDAFGPIQVMEVNQPSATRLEIILSEPVQSASVIFSLDQNGDNIIDANTGDTQGSLAILDSAGNIVNNITHVVSTRMIDGILRGVINVVSPVSIADFDMDTDLVINGGPTSLDEFSENPVLFDRSGLRSALRDFNNDPFGTLVDLNGDGYEG